MSEDLDIHWKQRFSNFKKALKTLVDAVNVANKRDLSTLEQQGLIQAFEYTHELAWKTLKDFIELRGNARIYGSRDATREAFKLGLIENGDAWMMMIESRNQTMHTYNEAVAEDIYDKIKNEYVHEFVRLEKTFTGLN